MTALEKRTVRTRLVVEVVAIDGSGAEKIVGEFTVRAEAGAWSDKEDIRGLTQNAVERLGKKARAMAAGVDNNEAARLK
jgi:hypothetical protein